MKKIHPEKYNDTEFIRLSRLPFTQMLQLKNWLPEYSIFTIQGENGTIQNCVHYDDYEFWFDNYKSENQEPEFSLF
ncbi:MAG: hypothetical protein MI975_10430 [Cytophagales bacterium]|nr:hypothetical protein [Cytophagales bacterium]